MISKQIFFLIIFLATFNHSSYAMKNENKSKEYEFCEMTCHRPSGYWQMISPTASAIKKTSKKDQREPWHIYSNYVAEPFCTVSNIPFFLVAYAVKNSNPLSAAALTCAGSASAISHAIPYQFLNDIDKFGALAATATVAYDANLYTNAGLSSAFHNQKIFFSLAAVAAIKLTDFWVARSKQIVKDSKGIFSENLIIKRKPEHTLIHVLRHLLAAWTAYTLLTAS